MAWRTTNIWFWAGSLSSAFTAAAASQSLCLEASIYISIYLLCMALCALCSVLCALCSVVYEDGTDDSDFRIQCHVDPSLAFFGERGKKEKRNTAELSGWFGSITR
mmetsp:Transcript_32358/g.71074  ORF Transcript_32358/g.71074 Transcript_32358/m.71074 type:complete len:106 (-) Transcript_32358:1149-1466(-)